MLVCHSMQKNQDMQEIQAKSQVMSNTLTFVYHGSCQRKNTFMGIFKGSKKKSRNILSDWTEIVEKCSKPSVGQELSENELNEQAAKMFCSF